MQEKPWHKSWPAGQPHSLDYPDITVDVFLRSAAHKFPDRTAQIYEGTPYTYSELWDKAKRFSAALAALGVRKGDVVAAHMPNCPQFAIVYYGILASGAVYTATNPLMTARELEKQLRDCGAKVVVTFDLFARTISEIRERLGLKHVIITSFDEAISRSPDGRSPGEGMIGLQDLLDRHAPEPPKIKLDPATDLAHLNYTGGTTGVS
ncbi:MAG: hypothetical protein CVU24_18175, partial [Betaproteobacteria bacterium HGW-Betaproteobacteria-18]